MIQSQQITLTGTVDGISKLLKHMDQWLWTYRVTVTLTPTSVTDATVGVTEQSQQKLRQAHEEWERKLASAQTEVASEMKKRLEGLFITLGIGDYPGDWWAAMEKMAEAIRAQKHLATFASERYDKILELERRLADAQGSVMAQSQQKSRQRYDALSESVSHLLTVHDELLEDVGETLPGDLREAIEDMRAAFVLDRNKARVLAAYPDAQCHRWGSPPYPQVILWNFESGTGGEVLGKGETEADAWSNARRLAEDALGTASPAQPHHKEREEQGE